MRSLSDTGPLVARRNGNRSGPPISSQSLLITDIEELWEVRFDQGLFGCRSVCRYWTGVPTTGASIATFGYCDSRPTLLGRCKCCKNTSPDAFRRLVIRGVGKMPHLPFLGATRVTATDCLTVHRVAFLPSDIYRGGESAWAAFLAAAHKDGVHITLRGRTRDQVTTRSSRFAVPGSIGNSRPRHISNTTTKPLQTRVLESEGAPQEGNCSTLKPTKLCQKPIPGGVGFAVGWRSAASQRCGKLTSG